MTIKAVWVLWPVALDVPERVLDDLAAWTDVNTIIVPPLPPQEDHAAHLRFVNLAKEKGFHIALDVCPLHLPSPECDDLRMVDIVGRRAHWDDRVAYCCPNHPQLLQMEGTCMGDSVAAMSSSLDIIHMNHAEYPVFPEHGLTDLLVCFCEHCRNQAEDQGIDFDAMKQEVVAFYQLLTTPSEESGQPFAYNADNVLKLLAERPQLAVWLDFRMDSLTEFLKQFTGVCREAGEEFQPDLTIGLTLYLPSIVKSFGTDYDELYPLFNWIAPKFPDYVTGSIIPVVADEISGDSKRGDSTVLRRVIRELIGLGPGPDVYQPCDPVEQGMYYRDTFDYSIVGDQMKHLQALQGEIPVVPCAWLCHHDLGRLQERLQCYRDNGMDGYLLWVWEADLTSDMIRKAQGVY